MRWRAISVILITLAAGVGLSAAIGLPTEGVTPAAPLPTTVEIDLPPSVRAGGTVTGSVTPAGTGEIHLIAAGSAGQPRVRVVGDTAWFEVGPPLTDRVGSISVLVPTSRGPAHANMTVEAGVASSIDPLAGPRTIVADGTDETMVVTIPTDELGNRLPDGTPVTVEMIRPDGGVSRSTAATEAGLAAVRFSSTTTAGPATIAARSGTVAGPAVRVDQVAGTPAPFSLELDETDAAIALRADGRSLHRIVTGELRDRHGNRLPDGVGVDVIIDSPDGRGHLVAVVAGGQAEFRVQAPTRSGPMTVQATIDATTSELLTLTFEPAVGQIPVRFAASGDEVIATIGPILDPNGAFVPDGTVAALGATTAIVQDGMAIARLAPDATGVQLTLSVLGANATVQVPTWN